MSIPDFQTLMLPLLQLVSEKKKIHVREATQTLAEQFNLTKEERAQLLPSGGSKLFDNRLGWAATHLKKAGILESPERGYLTITPRGQQLLSQNPEEIKLRILKQYPEYIEFISPKKKAENSEIEVEEQLEVTPQESIETGYSKLRINLENELLGIVKKSSPEFFERLVVALLVKMGYGGSLYDAGKAIGKSGDGGIDGIIKEDKLGLDAIYIQAKRWENISVSRPEVQKFAGALQGQKAKKGVYITTSTFTKEAQEFVRNIDSKIVLIDGHQLAELMIDSNIGVSTIATYEIKKIDTDYFTEE